VIYVIFYRRLHIIHSGHDINTLQIVDLVLYHLATLG
jgi:hypothetical protein